MSFLGLISWLPPRRGALGLLVFAVAGMHLVLLDPWLLPPARPDLPAWPMRTRQIVIAPRLPQTVPQPVPPPLPAPKAPRHAPHALSQAVPTATPELPTPAEPAPPQPARPVPTYATAPPPAGRFHYTVERGAQQGQATLDWSVADSRYTLRLQAELDGRPVLGATSRGGFDHAGLAPERFVETRRQRELRAANFEREAGEIIFSGPSQRAELAAGAQDRLSWWLQLAAVLQADPALQEVTLSVTGARGDSRVWTFVEQAPAADDATGLRPDGLRHFHRTAQHPYDTEIDIWPDPAQHHLPARLRLRFREGGDATTFTRRSDR